LNAGEISEKDVMQYSRKLGYHDAVRKHKRSPQKNISFFIDYPGCIILF